MIKKQQLLTIICLANNLKGKHHYNHKIAENKNPLQTIFEVIVSLLYEKINF